MRSIEWHAFDGTGGKTAKAVRTLSVRTEDALSDGVVLDIGLKAALYGLMIPVMSYFFESVASRCNEFENHRTETSYHAHLTSKVFSIRFIINKFK